MTKHTVWEIDADTSVRYNHGNGEISVEQDTRTNTGGMNNVILLTADEARELAIALAELRVVLDAEKIKQLGDVA